MNHRHWICQDLAGFDIVKLSVYDPTDVGDFAYIKIPCREGGDFFSRRENRIMFERRSYERIPFHQRAKIARWPSGEPFEAWSMDLSIHGVRLATEQAVPPRQAVVVTFHLRDPRQGEVSESVRGVVVRLHCDGDGYTCGVEFDNPLDASRQPLLFKKMNFVMS